MLYEELSVKLDGKIPGLQGRRILVSGAAGFIGARVTRMASELGAQVIAVVRPGSTPFRLSPFKNVARVEVDICDADGLKKAWELVEPEIVVHAAGRADWRPDPSLSLEMMRVHALGTAGVLEASRATAVKRVILLGSAGEYGAAPAPFEETGMASPVDPYSASKLAATELALTYHRAFDLDCAVVRPFVVYGPGEAGQRLFPTLFEAALREGGERAFTRGEQVRDFVYVDDVAEGVLRAATTPSASGKIINLGTGVGIRVRDAVSLANRISGNRVTPRFGARPSRIGEPRVFVANTTLCQATLSWTPTTSLEMGLTTMWADMTSRESSP